VGVTPSLGGCAQVGNSQKAIVAGWRHVWCRPWHCCNYPPTYSVNSSVTVPLEPNTPLPFTPTLNNHRHPLTFNFPTSDPAFLPFSAPSKRSWICFVHDSAFFLSYPGIPRRSADGAGFVFGPIIVLLMISCSCIIAISPSFFLFSSSTTHTT
jgi:hypothetical protein